jgi:hypothetical protein
VITIYVNSCSAILDRTTCSRVDESKFEALCCLFLISFLSLNDMVYLRKSNGFNLDVNALGKSFDSNAAASRLMGEPLLVLGVHILFRS